MSDTDSLFFFSLCFVRSFGLRPFFTPARYHRCFVALPLACLSDEKASAFTCRRAVWGLKKARVILEWKIFEPKELTR